MVSSQRVYNWYISLVAAACMVLYGYDASVYNAVLGSENWLAWFGNEEGPLDPVRDIFVIHAGMSLTRTAE